MNTYLKYKPVWYRIMVMGSLIGGSLIVLVVLAGFVIGKAGISVSDWESPEFSSSVKVTIQKMLLAAQTVLVFVVPAALYAYFADPRPMKFLRLNTRPVSWHLLVAAFIVLAAIPSAFWLGELNKTLDLSHTLPKLDKWIRDAETETNKMVELLIKNQSVKDLFINLLVMALLPAVGEELLFRGLLQKGLIRSFRMVWPGILLAAFIFAFIHFQFLTFLTRFELGIILGALFWYTGSLWASILAHFVFNAVQVYLSFARPDLKDAPAWSVSAGIVGGSFLIVILLIIILRKTSTVNMYEVYDDDDDFDFNVGHKDEYLDEE